MARLEIPVRSGLRFTASPPDFAPAARDLGNAETVGIEFEGRTFVWHELKPSPAMPPIPELRWGPTVTVLYDDSAPVDDREVAAASLARFLSALAFLYDMPVAAIAPTFVTGSGEGDPFWPAVHRHVDQFGGQVIRSAPTAIELTGDANVRLALGVFREAVSSESPYLAFLGWWGVLDAVLETSDAVDAFINEEAAAARAGEGLYSYPAEAITAAAMGDDVAHHLREHSRNAVAHVIRDRADFPHVDPDDPIARARLAAEGYWLRWIGRRAVLRRCPSPVTVEPKWFMP